MISGSSFWEGSRYALWLLQGPAACSVAGPRLGPGAVTQLSFKWAMLEWLLGINKFEPSRRNF